MRRVRKPLRDGKMESRTQRKGTHWKQTQTDFEATAEQMILALVGKMERGSE